eukprot:gene718-65_t
MSSTRTLEQKLAGTPSPLGRFMLPLTAVLFVWKFQLIIAGFMILPYTVDIWNYKHVDMPDFAWNAIASYVLLQIPDTFKNIVQKDDWTDR